MGPPPLGKDILPHAPRLNNDPSIVSLEMKIIDFIIRNNDERTLFMIRGLPILEKIAHVAHMNEIYVRANGLFSTFLETPPVNKNVCSCITDEKGNGIIKSLYEISYQIRHFAYNSDLVYS